MHKALRALKIRFLVEIGRWPGRVSRRDAGAAK